MTSTPTFPLAGLPLLRSLSENWWLLFLRGVAAITFGILFLVWPGHTFLILIYIYGAYVLVDGVLSLGAALFRQGNMAPRWWLALVGVAGFVTGLIAFAWPRMTVLTLFLLIASWAIVTGVLEIIGALKLRKEIKGELWLILNGFLAIALGVILFVIPHVGVAFIWVVGTYAILAGGALIGLAFRLKNLKQIP